MLTRRWFNTGPALRGTAKRLALLALLLAPCAQALEFQYIAPPPSGPQPAVARGLAISGTVVSGDTARLVELIRAAPADAWSALGRVELTIAGGDQAEALLLADTLAQLYPHTVATADCAGACAVVWLSGAWRALPQGRLGLQRPPAAPPAGQAVSGDAPPPFDALAASLRSYYLKQGVPVPLHERSLAAPGDAVYWLSEQELNATGTWPPYYYEKLHARCPRLGVSDESFHTLRRCAARLVVSQKAFAFDKLLAGVNDPWWRDNKDLFLNAPR